MKDFEIYYEETKEWITVKLSEATFGVGVPMKNYIVDGFRTPQDGEFYLANSSLTSPFITPLRNKPPNIIFCKPGTQFSLPNLYRVIVK